MNETLKIIAERYSCRAFDGRMPDSNTISEIAKAAVSAPSAMNRQPWRVIVVKNTDLIKEIDDAGMAIIKAMPDQTVYEKMMGRGGKLLYNAPCMMIVVIEPDERHGSLLDCGIVTENIALSAAALGVNSCICGMVNIPLAGDAGADFRKRLGFPEGFEFGVAVLLGYAAAEGTPHDAALDKLIVIE